MADFEVVDLRLTHLTRRKVRVGRRVVSVIAFPALDVVVVLLLLHAFLPLLAQQLVVVVEGLVHLVVGEVHASARWLLLVLIIISVSAANQVLLRLLESLLVLACVGGHRPLHASVIVVTDVLATDVFALLDLGPSHERDSLRRWTSGLPPRVVLDVLHYV